MRTSNYTNNYAIILGFLLITGCTGPSPHPKPSPTQAPKASTEQPAPPPATPAYEPARVKALIRRLTGHRRTLYSVSSNEYSYYMGGILTAVYRPGKQLFSIRPEGASSAAACSYDGEGRLQKPARSDTAASNCDRLLATLESSLNAP